MFLPERAGENMTLMANKWSTDSTSVATWKGNYKVTNERLTCKKERFEESETIGGREGDTFIFDWYEMKEFVLWYLLGRRSESNLRSIQLDNFPKHLGIGN